ncbi:MAG TPA: adenylate/guanylate cyclase domain-containing protein, partial [Candidatus Binatia bacterium]|nr:adenylate/guanylate cyclase domain-containing protein [Candidatus Binatia bacterium]
MICSGCHHENVPDAAFCEECGARFERRCPSCGNACAPTAKFCRGCGTNLTAPIIERSEARKIVTIIFADLAGSTALQERLDAESARAFMERYYRAMRAAVEGHSGTVVKLLGDGVMAAFGVPRVAEDDAIRAVRAAVAMQDAFRALAGEQRDIGLRVAVNTGEVVVTSDDSDVVGDPVNVAARLQQEAGNGDVVIGESTQRLVAALVTLAPLGSFALKGRSEAVKAYRVESLDRPATAITAAFVGREDELARLSAVYDAAVSKPAARLAVLLGSPGLGKSRLIDELGHRCGAAAYVIAAQCDAAGGATFAPLAEALREFLHPGGADSETSRSPGDPGMNSRAESLESPLKGTRGSSSGVGLSRLATTEPGNSFPGDPLRAAIESVLPASDAERARIAAGISALLAGAPAPPEETFFVIRRLLTGLAQTKPVVLVIDDLHWAEPLLLDLIEHLVQWGSGVPLLVLIGARPELRDLRSSLVTPGGLVSDVVTLGGLDAGAAMRLAANVIGAADLPAAVAAKILATSEGNPLFVGELVRMLVDEGAIERRGDRWIIGANLAALEMPPTIHALLAARIERLRPEERTVLERAAVVGRHFSRSAVAALLSRDGTALDARLEALRRTELIERDTGWFLGEPVLRFHHVLIRDAAYRRLLKGTRAELHERLADWIEAQVNDAAEHDETIGWHLEQAHQHLRELGPLDEKGKTLGARAATRLAAAGRRALARDDVPLAASLLGRAMERLDAADPARADLALDWCEALLSAGDVGPAAKAIDELGKFVDDATASGSLSWKKGGREGFANGSSAQIPLDPPFANGEVNRLHAWHTCFTAQLAVLTDPASLHTSADGVAAAAAELAKLDDAAGEAKAHSVHAQALARLGKVGACEAALDKALAAARKAGDRRRANAVLAGAPLAALWGPSPVTRASGRCLDVVRVLRITQGAPAVESVALSCQGVLEALRGRTEAARRMLASSRKMVEDLGIAHRLFEADAFAGRIAAMEGDAAAAERLLLSAYEGLRDLGLGIDAARAGALLARTLLALDRVAEAELLSHESERLAGDDLQAAIAWRGVRAEALAKRGEHAEAVELARAAVAIASTTDALLDHADARMALAAALRAAGRGTEADAEERRAIELWEAKGATLLAERVRSDRERVTPTVPAAAPIATATAVRRRVRPNAATAMNSRCLAALAARDFDALAAEFHEQYREIDHPTGSTYGRDAAIASVQRLFRSRGPHFEVEPIATLGERLVLSRRRTRASGDTRGRYDVGPYENEAIELSEVDASGVCCRAEIFAIDRLANAIARLYVRYAELLPDGPERERAAATARSLGTMLTAARDLERVAAVIAPDIEGIDHRHLSTWSMRGGAAFVEHLRALLEVAADVLIGTSDLLALEPSALLIRHKHSGTERVVGGAYERPFLVLFAIGDDGRLARAEWFDTDGETAALARFDALVAGAEAKRPLRRRVRPNAATGAIARFDAAFARRDTSAFATFFRDDYESTDHQNKNTYGWAGTLTSVEAVLRAQTPTWAHEPLATLGESLSLFRRRISAAGVVADRFDVGTFELDELVVHEVDAQGMGRRSETFVADQLGAAVSRLYERYAELLPDGPERARAAATARSVRVVAPGGVDLAGSFDLDGYAEVFRSDAAIVDHRVLGWGSSTEPQMLFRGMAAAREVGDQLMSRPQDVLALTHDALLLRWLSSGVGRESGGAFEWAFLRLFIFDPDGRVARYELFDADCEAEALARFDEIVGPGPLSAGAELKPLIRRRGRANAATRGIERFQSVIAARDGAALAEVFDESLHVLHHPTRATYGSREMLTQCRSMMKADRLDFRSEILASLGDALALARHFLSIEGLREAHLAGFGRSEFHEVVLIEADDRGRWVHVEIFAADRLSAAITRLYDRYAELLPEGTERERAAETARSIAAWNGPIDPERLATAMASSVENADHRRFGTWSARGPADYLKHWRLQDELAAGWALRDDAVLAIEPNAFLVRRAYFGTVRSTGGAFENRLLALFVFGSDGLTTRTEIWEPECEAEALARFDELTADARHAGTLPAGLQEGGTDSCPKIAGTTERSRLVSGRRVRPNAATAWRARFDAALAAHDFQAVAAGIHEELREIDHPTGSEYGRDAAVASLKRLFRSRAPYYEVEPLATLGERLLLTRRRTGASGDTRGRYDVGPYENKAIEVAEVDAHGVLCRQEIFAADRLGAALVRLYERYAELLPEGPARNRAAAVARSVAGWNGPIGPDRLATTVTPSMELVDHRNLGTWSTRGAAEFLDHTRLQTELAIGFTGRTD